MVGQRQIHQMIQRLNFRDCHAKISQVDSQATLGDGVVVQVSFFTSLCNVHVRRPAILVIIFLAHFPLFIISGDWRVV